MREMKDSGISWVGEIPKEWSVNRAKYCFVNTKEIAGCRSDRYERLALTMNGVIKRSKDDSNGLQPEKFETYQILRPDELVFKLIDLQNVSTSRVGLSPYLGLVSPAYIILKSNKRVLPAFAEKYFLMLWKNQIFNALGDAGVRSNLNSKDLLELSIPFPSLDEQQRIAEFLDRECGKIDGLKADIQAQIDTLEQYKRSVITEAVTHGLNPSAPMKECSVSWARQIPQHWKVMPNKHLMTKIKNICPIYKGEDILSLTMYGVIVRDLDAGGKMPSSFDGYQYIKKGNLLMCLFDIDVTPRCIGITKSMDEALLYAKKSEALQKEKDNNSHYTNVGKELARTNPTEYRRIVHGKPKTINNFFDSVLSLFTPDVVRQVPRLQQIEAEIEEERKKQEKQGKNNNHK